MQCKEKRQNMEQTKSEKFVDAVMKKDNIKAQEVLERIVKEKVAKKIANVLNH